MADARREESLTVRLARAGVLEPTRGLTLLSDPDFDQVLGLDEPTLCAPNSQLFAALGQTPDPDLALLTLVRLCAAISQETKTGETDRLTGLLRSLFVAPDPLSPASAPELSRAHSLLRLFMLIGHSKALGDHVVRHPSLLTTVLGTTGPQGPDHTWPSAQAIHKRLLTSVGAQPTNQAANQVATLPPDQATTALRTTYYEILIDIACHDLSHPHPESVIDSVAQALADLAGAAIEAALAIARSKLTDHGNGTHLAVMGLGKCGGQELNYISDVDVIYVVEPGPGTSVEHAIKVGTQLASDLTLICSAPGAEPALWPVDAALRPEGKNGPLVRTVESHRAYYQRWAQTWEFQALLKARHIAGDAHVAHAYLDAITPLIWAAASRPDFVEDSQAMRRRVEDNVPAGQSERQLKLGKGGLRDIEFTVQLLQLVHGRHDHTIHSPTTLTALEQLAAAGYVGREHAQELAQCYRFLRLLEHRLQLRNLKRTHLMPTATGDLEILARSAGMAKTGTKGLLDRWTTVKRQVRTLHKALFYRPLLPATARLSPEEASLAPEAAQARLAAIGYKDPAGAMNHIQALTDGLTRRAAIQRQLLPVMLGWFSQGADPDQGLLNFRTLSDELGSTHWYLKLLRDSGAAAKRLAYLLSTSQYVHELLSQSQEAIQWLDKDQDLDILDRPRLEAEITAVIARAQSATAAITTVRAIRRRELTRIALAEMLANPGPRAVAVGITAVAEATISGALAIATAELAHDGGPNFCEPADFAVIAMGSMGAHEMGYGSDGDVMFVYEPGPQSDPQVAQQYAQRLSMRIRELLTEHNPEPALIIDMDLRPEGRNGPLVRSFASYAAYYERWSAPWESQALLRARPIAGDAKLGAKFVALIDPLRYPEQGIAPHELKEIRRIKARMEAERLPRGVDPNRHLKLGRGSITDVEWMVQTFQLQNGATHVQLRTTQTLTGLHGAQEVGLIGVKDAEVLARAWQFASNIRDAIVLWTGRATGQHIDVLPADRRSLGAVSRILGYGPGQASALEEDYLRSARLARRVMTKSFYGE